MMRPTLLPLAALALTACTHPVSPEPPAPAEAGVQCDANRVQNLVGQPGASVIEEARTRAGAKVARVLRPGQIVTMEFRSDRLNIHVDESGKVTRISCG